MAGTARRRVLPATFVFGRPAWNLARAASYYMKHAHQRPRVDRALEQARAAALACLDQKANDVVLLDLKGVSGMTDYFVIASGTSDTHVRSVAERVIDALRSIGVRPHVVEGLNEGRWVVVDFTDFVVHVFHPTLRTYYQLERLWGDAPEMAISHS